MKICRFLSRCRPWAPSILAATALLCTISSLHASEETILTDQTGAENNDHFGWSVAIDGAYAIVGSPSHDASAEMAGAAYVFKDHGDGWSQIAKLGSSDPSEHAFFGWDVALSTAHAIVGANGVDVVGTNDGAADAFRK